MLFLKIILLLLILQIGLIWKSNNGIVEGYDFFNSEEGLDANDNKQILLSSERRSVLFVGNMTVEAMDSNITINLLPGTVENRMNWRILKNGESMLETPRINTNIYSRDIDFHDHEDDTTNLGGFSFSCVTTYDSGLYQLKQLNSLNTGFNIKTEPFNLTVLGENLETLQIIEPPSSLVISGIAFVSQPVIRFGNVANLTSHGKIQAFIAKSPSKKQSFIVTGETEVDKERKLFKFINLAILGESGDYTIGFVDSDTCEIVILPFPIHVNPYYNILSIMLGVALLIGVLITACTATLLWFVSYKYSNRAFVSLLLSIRIPMEELVKKKGEAMKIFFKFQHIFIIQSLIIAILSIILIIPVTVKGDNNLFDVYLLSQSNWESDSPYLFVYQVLIGMMFVLMLFGYTRFNEERIYQSYDENHLVQSRTVLLTGLPKSLIDCSILKEFLQTGYSKGIYSLSIIIEKTFSQHDQIHDLNGNMELIQIEDYNNNNNDEIKNISLLESIGGTILSSRNAFITFSCVSDAHLFKTQFSPNKWSWAKSITPVPPQDYKNEMNIKGWKAYTAPKMSDILWTKLHNPNNYHSKPVTAFLVFMAIFCGSSVSFAVYMLFSVQYKYHTDYEVTDGRAITVWSYFVYTLIPCILLLILIKLAPIVIKMIYDKSNIYKRSELKKQMFSWTLATQAILIFTVPSCAFISDMKYQPQDYYYEPNSFFYPIAFMKSGGFFYAQFIILFSIATPFIDCTNLFRIIQRLVMNFIKKRVQDEDTFFSSTLNLTAHYSNSLLMILLVFCYGPIFPVLFIFLFLYMLMKYHFIKYLAITTKTSVPPSDTNLVVPVQDGLWTVMTLTFSFHFLYVVNFYRFDLMFAYAFLFVVCFGRYIPNFTRSVCYSYCDGAVLSCSNFFKDASEDNAESIEYSDEDDSKDDEILRDEFKEQQKSHEDLSHRNSANTNNTNTEEVIDIDEQQPTSLTQSSKFDKIIQNEDQVPRQLKEKQHKNLKETILRLKQRYWSNFNNGIFSFGALYRLPKPKPITITTYSSPFYKLECAECVISQDDNDYLIAKKYYQQQHQFDYDYDD